MIWWVWFQKAHVLINGLTADNAYQSKKTSPEVKRTACRAQKQVCVKPHIWGRVQKKKLCFTEGSQKHVVSVTLNGRSLKQPGLFLELDICSNWATDGEGYCGDQEPDGHSSWAPWSYMQMGETYRRTNITATLHWALWQCGKTQSSLQVRHMKTHLECAKKKAPKGPSDCEKQDSLVWWTSIPNIMFEGNQLCSSAAEYHPKSKVCW